MKTNHNILFTPFKIGEVEIKNRFVLCSITGTSLISKNKFNERVRPYYLERAKGGVGLIISGCSVVYDMFGRDYWVNDAADVFQGPIKELMDQIHKTGTKFFMQIGAGLGRVVNLDTGEKFSGANMGNIQFASSEMPNVWNPRKTHREITRAEILKITNAMIETAVLAKEAGIDGVEIHAVHEGYLLDQFAISNMNNRKDEYGGSLENRLRFATDIIKGIKKSCGKDFPVSVRYGVVSKMKGFNSGALPMENYVEFGRTLEESPAAADLLVKAGADALNSDNGSYDSWYWAHPPMYMGEGCNLPEAEYIRNFVDVPVICAGRMENPDLASEAIRRGNIDGIGIARQLLADPEYPNKVQQGAQEEIRPCIACHNGCLGALLEGKGVSCALRPASMQEEKYKLFPAKTKKKVMIIGGGIGGMEAARLADLRGHEVSLYEKSNSLGGAFIAAAAPSFKEADKKLISWYGHELEKSNVNVVMDTSVDAELIKEHAPDAVIIATGASPRHIPIQGAERSHVIEVKDLLLGGCQVKGSVVVAGGGLSGCEAAYELALKGNKVTIVEMADQILRAPLLSMANSTMLKDLLKFHHVEIMTGTKLNKILENQIEVETAEGSKTLRADHVVLAMGYVPGTELDITGLANEVYTVGDAEHVGCLLDVIWKAYDVALKL